MKDGPTRDPRAGDVSRMRADELIQFVAAIPKLPPPRQVLSTRLDHVGPRRLRFLYLFLHLWKHILPAVLICGSALLSLKQWKVAEVDHPTAYAQLVQ